MSASRSRWCWPPIRMSPSRRVQPDRGRIRGTARGLRRGRGDDARRHRPRRAEARRHVSRPQASRRPHAAPTSRSTIICAAATSTRRSPRADHVFEHTFRTQQVLHLPLEPFVSLAEPGDDAADHPHRLADAVVRAHRDRAPARLAGEPRAREGAASRRRLRRQGLHQARGAGRGAGADRAPAGEDRADDGGAVLHDHQAPDDVPHQERRRQGRPRRRARTARCAGTAAPMPTSARA